MAERRKGRRWWPLLVMVVGLEGAAAPTTASPPGWASWGVGSGVEHLLTERPGLVAHAARIPAGASVALRPVVAFDRVGGGHAAYDGRQPVSELCRRAGGIVCVNADFFNCGVCGQPAGGLVDRMRPLRSFRPDHEQVSIVGGRPTFDPLAWVGGLRGVVGPNRFRLALGSLNRGPLPGRAVLYTPDWGPTTPQVAGQVELVLATGGPYVAGVSHAVPVARRTTGGVIPRDGIVIAANGRAAEQLNWLWDAWHATAGPRQLVLDTALSAPADLSIGGHPILLRDGIRQSLDGRDPMVTRRHPRTILAWTESAELLLVTIDGRQPGYSAGATLSEATDLLVELGATNAMNLDGGGSTTFALRCDIGACVANRPSEGRERPVPLALAVVLANAPAVLKAAAVAPEVTPEPTPPPTTTTVAPPAVVVPPPPTEPITVATTSERSVPPELVALDPRPIAPRPTTVATVQRSTTVAPIAAIAIAAIGGWAVAAARMLTRMRRER